MMKPYKPLLPLVVTIIVFAGFRVDYKEESWTTLFNGKDFKGWDTYIGPDMDSLGKKIGTPPVGLNKDPRKVFTVVADNGKKVIRISGESWGAISTKKEYDNYHFQLQFKWGQLTWGQKKNKKKDNGLLYHSVGAYGADYGAWMRSQELQVEEGNCGDYWGVAGGVQDIPATKNANNDYVYDAKGTMMTFSEKSAIGRHCIKSADAENPSGEWNTLDLYCHGDTSIHVMNGKTVMVLYRSRQLDNGKESPLTKGKLQIQSEGAEVFYKEIKIGQIVKLPEELIY